VLKHFALGYPQRAMPLLAWRKKVVSGASHIIGEFTENANR
jgi:hypothetical protein